MHWNHVRKTGNRAGSQTGLAVWLLGKLRMRLSGARRADGSSAPRLALVERISIAPRQTLALIEAEGRRFLVASSEDGAAAFYPVDGGVTKARGVKARVSW